MLCNFLKIGNKWLCENCGRMTPYEGSIYMPTAKCRIPENYKITSGYIQNYKTKGVGDFLSEIFKRLGYDYDPLGTARTRLTYMNKKGVDWCERNQDRIVEWIKAECPSRRIIFLEFPARAILRLAIRKTKNQFTTV